ncbi:cysteine-rich and transmembrane domain-containing protein A [Melia azedarach]|uniref:Cysteine-rich and transmembrane domain-containing protein A n=1 Tax=Melia azedarach TaxID=155640 RepID=A0ACC1XMI9_MELAZ|nr:cysteine-rich and transmembrane domain-containing protein A [Melia azedarach]
MAQEHTTGDKNQPMIEHQPPEAQKTGGKRKCSLCGRFAAARTKKRGDRSFLEGCLFALCCCWLCDACFDVSVVVG